MEAGRRVGGQIFWREFLCLWGPGVAFFAAASLLIHLPAAGLQRLLLIPLHTQSTGLLLAAWNCQNSVRLAIPVGIGLIAAHRLGLGAPVLSAWLRGEPVRWLLRMPALPILLTAVLAVACSVISNSSVLHPDREREAKAAVQLANSPAGAKLAAQVDRLGLAATGPYSTGSLIISDLSSAVDGELNARLFELSVIALLFVYLFEKQNAPDNRKCIWAAILIVALLNTSYALWARHENTLMVSEMIRGLGVPLRATPGWLVALRGSIQLLPLAIALGWLYSRYGIESAIAAGFFGAVMSNWIIGFWMMHFPL